MRSPIRRPGGPRRGVTLVEMLVVVALVILMMTILVQIFQSATGAMSLSRTTQELDVVLRQVDSMIRADLNGSTAKMTPPNDPTQKTGYFEYGENGPADLQGEDTDDYMAFTTKAPQGQVFSGRQFIRIYDAAGRPIESNQPTTITSQVGEVIYFLRNGNLYRRVFLVAPERAKSIKAGTGSPARSGGYNTSPFGFSFVASWQGLNDISCRPGQFSTSFGPLSPMPNDLGDLTNRENRAFRPRFSNDFNPQDGIPDDRNGDGVFDYWPTLYYDGSGGYPLKDTNGNTVDWLPNSSMGENQPVSMPFPSGGSRIAQGTANVYDVYAFPYIYPGMYSVPEGATVGGSGNVTPPGNNLGWRHGLFPNTNANGGLVYNHSPLDIGDNLLPPAQNQTWFGFPTWRETMTGYTGARGWGDPVASVINLNGTQPLGLRPLNPTQAYSIHATSFPTPLSLPGTSNPPPYSDGAGSASFIANPTAPNQLWEDDLILTNVRSFDIKAYDPDAPLYNSAGGGLFSAGYHDLGYGGFLAGSSPQFIGSNGEPRGFGHEGRIPALTTDLRLDPRTGLSIGDNHPGVIRLNRVWDSWSTDYSTNAPASDNFLHGYIPGLTNPVTSPPIYPAFPAPYPSPLRGLQIQIRIVDPRNERSKVLTIRHDFTDKL